MSIEMTDIVYEKSEVDLMVAEVQADADTNTADIVVVAEDIASNLVDIIANTDRIQLLEDDLYAVPEFIGNSLATSQGPSTTDTPYQLEFGALQDSTHASLGVDGTMTFHTVGKYKVVLHAHFGRNSGTGQSLIFGRFMLEGVQVGHTVHASIADADVILPFTGSFEMQTSGVDDTMVFEMIRDSAGDNSGAVYYGNPTLAGWDNSPCATISITKI